MIKIRPYNMSSKSARLLAEALSKELGYKVFRTVNPKYMRNHTIINWGTGVDAGRCILNRSVDVDTAINKLDCFRVLRDNQFKAIPDWTTNKYTASRWVEAGNIVYCRTLLTSKEGKGIVIAEKQEQLVDAPLYTKRFVNGREYRIHVAFGKVIQAVQKKKRLGNAHVDARIRSNNNWVFARILNKPVPDDVLSVAVDAVEILNLDFGAVDVVYSVKKDKACVLEVNTAPGIDNTSAAIYAKAFVEELR